MLSRKLIHSLKASRFFSYSPQAEKHKVVLLPGDGIGPEITDACLKIFNHLDIPIEWEYHKIHTKATNAAGDLISDETIQAIRDYKYALKGPFATPIGKGHRSLNVTLRKKQQLFSNVRPCKTIEGVKGIPFDNVDVVTIRENTEGEYSGLEHEVVPGVVENLKIISKNACQNVCRYAFEYAKANNRNQITCVHKAGVCQLGDQAFLDVFREMQTEYPEIIATEAQVDTIAMRLVRNPSEVDVMVMPNLYGDIISDLCAGLIGGLGLTSSGNIGANVAVYEAVHGSAPDIAGRNLANPTALLLSGCMMLTEMGMVRESDQIRNSSYEVIKEGEFVTGDLDGHASTTHYVEAILRKMDRTGLRSLEA